jgi:hypothetical protein
VSYLFISGWVRLSVEALLSLRHSVYAATKVRVTLRPLVNRPIRLGVKPHLGPKTWCPLLSFAVLPIPESVLSDERRGYFIAVVVPSTSSFFLQFYMLVFSIASCQESGSFSYCVQFYM